MDHARHIHLNDAELTEAVLNGATIYGPGDEKIGHVSEVHGSAAKPAAVPAHELDFMRDESNAVHAVTRWTKDELKALPEHRQ